VRDGINNVVMDLTGVNLVVIIGNHTDLESGLVVIKAQGLFYISFTPTKAGSKMRDIQMTGIVTDSGTIMSGDGTWDIMPGPIDATQSNISASMPVTAGQVLKLELRMRDAYRNAIESATLVAFVQDPLGRPKSSTLTEASGVYTISVASVDTHTAGEYTFTFTVDGRIFQLAATPTVTGLVNPGTFAFQETSVEYIGQATAGSQVNVDVLIRDSYGNPLDITLSAAEVAKFASLFVTYKDDKGPLSISTCEQKLAHEDDLPAGVISLAFEDKSSDFTNVSFTSAAGKLVLKFTPKTIGSFHTDLTYAGAGKLICSYNSFVTVVAGAFSAPDSKIVAPESCIAGKQLMIDIFLQDKFGNPIADDACAFLEAINVTTSTGSLVPQYPVLLTCEDLPSAIIGSRPRKYVVELITTIAGTKKIEIVLGGVVIDATAPAVLVLANAPADFSLAGKLDARVGTENSFTLSATDIYLNTVSVNNAHTYTVGFMLVEAASGRLLYTVPSIVVATTNGSHSVTFFSAVSGNFSMRVTMVTLEQQFLNYKELHVIIFSQACPVATPFRCGYANSDTCVASYAECTDLDTTCAAGEILCVGAGIIKSCAASSELCPCPVGEVRCVTGQCATSASCTSADSEPAEACPDYAKVKCIGGGCRTDIKLCPSSVKCPPGYGMCPDGATCVDPANADVCPTAPVCTSGTLCPDNSCAASILQCPTKPTCVDSVLCSDYSCQASSSACPTQYECLDASGAAMARCPGGSCMPLAVNGTQLVCPSSVTCPVGYLRCANGQCTLDYARCAEAELTCAAQRKVRCSDSSCQLSLFDCPSVPICPDNMPVQCSDLACVADVFECNPPSLSYCPETQFTCPDLSCVSDSTRCATGIKCPDNWPLLCTDMRCVLDRDECTATDVCPYSSPVRCSDGICRGNIQDCSRQTQCPAQRPVKCPDGYCAAAISMCKADPPQLECTDVTFNHRCGNGECVEAASFCPAHVSCSSDFTRCEVRITTTNAELLQYFKRPQLQDLLQ
jgi:hypothetical protein